MSCSFKLTGPIAEITLPVDKISHQLKGFGVITFMMPEHAVKAYTELDGSVFCGRMLHLLPGKQKDEANDDGIILQYSCFIFQNMFAHSGLFFSDSLTFKQKKEKKLREQSGSSHNWNTLFLGANAVADAIANTYDTTKEKLLDGNSSIYFFS